MFPQRHLRHDGRALLYESLAQLIDAGVPLDACVRSLHGAIKDTHSRRVLDAIEAAVARNEPLSKGLEHAVGDIPRYHPRALASAEQSGNPAATLRSFAVDEQRQSDQQKELIRRSAYPILVVNLAIFAPSAGALINNPGGTLPSLLAIMALIDGALFLLFKSLTTPVQGPFWSRLALRVPVLGRAVRDRDHGRYLRALHQLYEAGVSLHEATSHALDAVENAAVATELSTIPQTLAERQALSVGVALVPAMRNELTAILTTAEPAGELGDGLSRAAELAIAQGDSGCRRVILGVTGGLYGAVVIYVVYVVLNFWTGYFNRLSGL